MENKKNVIILSIIFLILSIFFWGKTGNMLIDFSRESYIPYQIFSGEKLFKDIFLIYGPIGYIINALLYTIKININLLLLEAHLISYGISILFYFILNKFFTSKLSLTLTILFISISIFSNSTFSFVLPYSYSTLWAVLGIFSTLFALLYNRKNILFLSLGLILCSKIEFFVPTFFISIFYLIKQKENFSKNLTYILIFPGFCALYFLCNKVNFDDIFKNYYYLKTMLNTNSLKYLYKGMGTFFNIKYIQYNIILTVKLIIIGAISYIAFLSKKETLSYIILIIGFKFIETNFSLNLIGFFAIFLTILSLKKRFMSKEELLLFAFAIILTSKAFFAINSLSYSNFGYCIMIFYTYLQLQKFLNKKWLINSLIIYLIFNIAFNLAFYFTNQKNTIKSNVGNLYINKNESELFNKTNFYIKKNIKRDEAFIVVPEGQIFNLIHKKPYNFLNSTFTPLDFDTFGEKNIIKNLQNNKTDYIIFYPRNTKDYGASTMCFDYAVDFCNFIIDNYTQVATIKEKDEVRIYKIKNEK